MLTPTTGSTFTVFVLIQDKPLTTEIGFPALPLFNLPWVISAIVEASVAVISIRSFLAAEELQPDAVIREGEVSKFGEESLRITDGTFTWNRAEVGMVGKSSFLQAILGNLWKVKGEVVVRGSIAYVAQQPWIMNASVRENIVFGHGFDPEFYQETIRACALLQDFDALPDGDENEVGEKGIFLSGGQKDRLTLARAVYARADIYLLDNPLSAVDQHVGRHLVDNVLGSKGILADKTRVMTTNSIHILIEAHHILLLANGQIFESDPMI
ncbi:ATP-binding cassette glutathione S-conjugate transporter ycf1 [Rhizina undulata]